MKKLYVGSLPFSINSQQLKEIFQAYGQVTSAKVIFDKVSGRSKGFGFVEFADDEEGTKACQALHDAEVEGRKIIVSEAKSQSTDHKPRGPRY